MVFLNFFHVKRRERNRRKENHILFLGLEYPIFVKDKNVLSLFGGHNRVCWVVSYGDRYLDFMELLLANTLDIIKFIIFYYSKCFILTSIHICGPTQIQWD